jgi:hypothetical protein
MTKSNQSEEYWEIDEKEEDAPTIQLTDEDGRSLLCYIEKSVEVDGEKYLLLMPVDAPIEIFAWEASDDDEDEESLVDIEEDEIDDVFDTAKAVLSEQELILQRSALTLTASGDLPDADEEDIITLDVGEDEDDVTMEQFQLLASFFYEEQEYAVCTPFEPLLFFARMDATGKPELLSPEDYEAVRSQLEDQLFDELE